VSGFVPSIHVNVETNELRRLLFWFKKEFARLVKSETEEYGQFFQVAIHNDIMELARKSPPPPLKPSTVKRKRTRGLPSPTQSWLATGFTLNNLFQERYWAAGGHRFRIQPSRKHHRNEKRERRTIGGAPITVEMIVGWLEYGLPSNKQPARPVIQVALKNIASGQSKRFTGAGHKAAEYLARQVMTSLRTNV